MEESKNLYKCKDSIYKEDLCRYLALNAQCEHYYCKLHCICLDYSELLHKECFLPKEKFKLLEKKEIEANLFSQQNGV